MPQQTPASPAQSVTAQVLAGMTGVAAAVVGVLYLVGILVTSAELFNEGISLRDTIPLLPLQQLLSRGVSLVLPMLALLVGAVLLLLALEAWEGAVSRTAGGVLSKQAAQDPAVGQALGKRDWEEVGKQLSAATAAEADGERKRALRHAHWHVRGVNWAQLALWFSIMFIAPFLVPWVISIGCFLVGAAWIALGARPVRYHLVVGYAIILVAALASPWFDPRPLPDATVSTDRTSSTKGKLLFVADGSWYLSASGELKVIPGGQVSSSRVDYPEGRRLVFEHLAD